PAPGRRARLRGEHARARGHHAVAEADAAHQHNQAGGRRGERQQQERGHQEPGAGQHDRTEAVPVDPAADRRTQQHRHHARRREEEIHFRVAAAEGHQVQGQRRVQEVDRDVGAGRDAEAGAEGRGEERRSRAHSECCFKDQSTTAPAGPPASAGYPTAAPSTAPPPPRSWAAASVANTTSPTTPAVVPSAARPGGGAQMVAGASAQPAPPSASRVSVHGSTGHRLARAAAPKSAAQRPRSRPISPPPVRSSAPRRSRSATLEARNRASPAASMNAWSVRRHGSANSATPGTSRNRSGVTPPRNRSGDWSTA